MATGKIDVVVTSHTKGVTTVINDRGGRRAWSGEGASASESTTRAFEKFLGDRRSAEYLRSPKDN